MAPRVVTPDELAPAVTAAFGGRRRLTGLERMRGGTQKGVYRLTLDDESTVAAYVWEASENYWPATPWDGDAADPFAPSSGFGLEVFEPAWKRLNSIGVPVPEVHLLDREHRYYPADLAIVEDCPGENLMELLARDPQAAAPALSRLAEALEAMRLYRAPVYGKVTHIDAGGTSHDASCESSALTFGLRCLSDAAARDERIAGARDLLEAKLHALAADVRPRAEYSVVHGELGLDHVMLGRDGRPVLIDLDNLMYFDVEWEHVFLRIRLHEDYRYLAVDGLDEARLALYMLIQRLSLTAGPLRLLEGDFPDRAFMLGIAEHNGNAALELVGASGR